MNNYNQFIRFDLINIWAEDSRGIFIIVLYLAVYQSANILASISSIIVSFYNLLQSFKLSKQLLYQIKKIKFSCSCKLFITWYNYHGIQQQYTQSHFITLNIYGFNFHLIGDILMPLLHYLEMGLAGLPSNYYYGVIHQLTRSKSLLDLARGPTYNLPVPRQPLQH